MSGFSSYNPANWYWAVGGSATQVWSSARAQYVPVSDADYQAWIANVYPAPTPIPNATELYNVLMDQWTPSAQSPGVQVKSTATPALSGTYAIDVAATANLSALSTGIAAGKPIPGGGTTFIYLDLASAPHAFGAADFLNFATAIENYLYNFNIQLLSLLNGVSGAALPSTILSIP